MSDIPALYHELEAANDDDAPQGAWWAKMEEVCARHDTDFSSVVEGWAKWYNAEMEKKFGKAGQ